MMWGLGCKGGGGWGGEKSGLIGLGCEVWGMWGEGSGVWDERRCSAPVTTLRRTPRCITLCVVRSAAVFYCAEFMNIIFCNKNPK